MHPKLRKGITAISDFINKPMIRGISKLSANLLNTMYLMKDSHPISVIAGGASLVNSLAESFDLPKISPLDSYIRAQNLVPSIGTLSKLVYMSDYFRDCEKNFVFSSEDENLIELVINEKNKLYIVEYENQHVSLGSERGQKISDEFFFTKDFDFELLFDKIWAYYKNGIFLKRHKHNFSIELRALPEKTPIYIGEHDPVEFHYKLKRSIDANISRSYLFNGPPGTGKAQPMTAKIATPTGWKTMGDLNLHDEILAPDGTATRVVGIFDQGEKEIYQVTFSDGASTECCIEHLWSIQDKEGRAKNPDAYTTVSLEDIADKLFRSDGEHKYSIPLVDQISFQERDFLIKPYTMGALIGDGGLTSTSVIFTTADDAILNEITMELPPGFIINKTAENGILFRISYLPIKNITGHYSPIIDELKKLGFWKGHSYEKFIPVAYLQSSFKSRVRLLQGLMDTDGTVDHQTGALSYSTSSPRLCNDVVDLVRSLGGIAKVSTKIPSFFYKGEEKSGRLSYTISINLPNSILPFNLSRKNDLVIEKTKYTPRRYISSIKPVGKKLARCIKVAHPDERYITDDYIVTHNTSFAMKIACDYFKRIVKIDPAMARSLDVGELEFFVEQLRPDVIIFDDFDRAFTSADVALFMLENLKETFPKLVIFGTVNNLAKLDKALIRPGRFDQILWFGYPGFEDRRKILLTYFEEFGHEISDDFLDRIALASQSLTPVYLKELAIESRNIIGDNFEKDLNLLIKDFIIRGNVEAASDENSTAISDDEDSTDQQIKQFELDPEIEKTLREGLSDEEWADLQDEINGD